MVAQINVQTLPGHHPVFQPHQVLANRRFLVNAPVEFDPGAIDKSAILPAKAAIFKRIVRYVGMMGEAGGQHRDFLFRIRRLKEPGESATVAFNIEADSWFLRLFAPNLEVRYDRQTGRLLSYQGASNLLDADRSVQKVTITYRYADSKR